jgi:hypothetical protein
MNADSAGGLYVIWEDARNGSPDIYLRHRLAPFVQDIACTGIVQPGGWASTSQPVLPILTICNDGSQNQSNIPVSFQIDSSGASVYAGWDTFPGPLQPEVSAQCAMTTQWMPCASFLTRYDIAAFCHLSGDQSRGNDTVKSSCTTCSWFDDLQHDSCHLRTNAGWRWGEPNDSSARCWGDPLIDTVLRVANDSLYFDRLVANIDTPKIAWSSWYLTYPGSPDAGYRLRCTTDSGRTWTLTHASLPLGRGYDGVVDGDSAYWGQCPGDTWERMIHRIPVTKGTVFSLCWQYEDLFGSFYPGVLIGNIVSLGFARPTPVAEIKITSPVFHLSITPNPCHGSTHISYSLPQAGNVSVKLYDVAGALVRALSEGRCTAGAHTAELDAKKLERGVYILKFASGSYRRTAKLIFE